MRAPKNKVARKLRKKAKRRPRELRWSLAPRYLLSGLLVHGKDGIEYMYDGHENSIQYLELDRAMKNRCDPQRNCYVCQDDD